MKILVVDDSRAMRMIVIRTLRRAGFGSHTVTEASDGKEALAAIQDQEPDLVLTDWAMPEMTGIELLHAVKDQGIRVKIGVVTSQGTPDMQQQAKNAGAIFLLTKPFTVDSFKELLDPVLG